MESFKIIPIPTVAAQYNDEMNHVDRGDQIRSYTTYEHRFRRGPWQALLWSFLLEVTLANSFILQLNAAAPLEALHNAKELEGMYLQRHFQQVCC
jgi:hypothetical protein